MDRSAALPHYSAAATVLGVVAAVVFIAVASAAIHAALLRRGRRPPRPVRIVHRASSWLVDQLKRPLTVAVLDEVVDVLRTGHYTVNVAAALDENHMALKHLITEKVLADRAASRSLARVPFSRRVVEEVADAGLRVLFEVLLDGRMDELVSDLLRDNVRQIRENVVAAG